MKIAQVVSLQESVPPRGKNGLEYVVYYLIEELVRRGHEVTLFGTKDSKTSARLVEVLPYPAAKKWIFGWSPIDYSLASMTKAAEMAEGFDIIHTHIGHTVCYFANLIKTPIIETVHNPLYKFSRRHKFKKTAPNYYFKDSKRRYNKMHHVYVSHVQRKNISNKKNSSVIHNGISLKDFSFKRNPKDYFVYLGYISADKGAHIAVRAAKKAGVKLKLAGSYKGCEEYFRKKIKPYLRKDQIEYVGIANPAARNKLLGGAKGILFPIQWEEPFGLAIIEAMACGTPVIGFNRAAVPEIVKDGKTGFVVKDEKEMIKAIKRIGEIERKDCRRHVEKYFTVERMADEYERIYEKVVDLNKRRCR